MTNGSMQERKKKKQGMGEWISYRCTPLISGAPAARCLFGSSSLPLLPTVSLLTATVNNQVCELPPTGPEGISHAALT